MARACVASYWLRDDVVFVAHVTDGVVYNPLWPVYPSTKDQDEFLRVFKVALGACRFDPSTRSVLPQPLQRLADERGLASISVMLRKAVGVAVLVGDESTAITLYRDRTTWDPYETIPVVEANAVGCKLWSVVRERLSSGG